MRGTLLVPVFSITVFSASLYFQPSVSAAYTPAAAQKRENIAILPVCFAEEYLFLCFFVSILSLPWLKLSKDSMVLRIPYG